MREATSVAKKDRMITANLEASIGLNGVRESDDFILDIFQEKKKSFKLNRTKYHIQCSEKFEFDFVNADIKLPYFGHEEGHYLLELVSNESSGRYDDRSRYIFKSLGGTAFRLNGIHCFEAFLERGDVIDIGFNRIYFPRNACLVEDKKISEKLIKSQIGILIEGETGTGKTTLAKRIHEESGRYGRFVHLNLSAFAPSLIESELFGHVKGAFTGALNSKKGAILEAHKGTLFLDEIDSLTLDLQTKLLLFLDNYEVRAVGGESTKKADVRMIFASGSKLVQRIESGQMRRDFYFRLQAGSSIFLENLRDRPERIRELCLNFESKEFVVIGAELLNFYTTCSWPGNIRQLQSHLVKKKTFSEGKKLVFDDLDKELMSTLALKVHNEKILPLDKIKINYCYDTFLRLDKNITKTAKILELCPNTLKSYLQKKEEELRDHNVIHVDF